MSGLDSIAEHVEHGGVSFDVPNEKGFFERWKLARCSSIHMALGDGRHKLPIKADVRAALGKGPGDSVVIHLNERLER